MHPAIHCRNCRHRKAHKARGLCWCCYHEPGVRDRFTSGHRSAYRGRGLGNGGFELPPGPTSAPPGSPEKVAVLEERVLQRVQLWHPGDARLDAGA